MPFIPNTPEHHAAVLSPPTTAPTTPGTAPPQHLCKGLTNTGRPCARPAPTPKSASPTSSGGILTTVAGHTSYFCPRHADQAKDVVLRHTASFSRRRALVGRGSMDTLIEQVEVLVGDGAGGRSVTTKLVSTTRKVPVGSDPFRAPRDDDDDDDDEGEKGGKGPVRPPTPPRGERGREGPGFWSRLLMGCCCIPSPERGEKRREAELRQAAAGVVGGVVGGVGPAQGRKASGGAKVRFGDAVPPPPPLPMMYPVRKPPASAMAKPTAAPTLAPTIAGLGASPATPASAGSAGGNASDDGSAKLVDLSTLTREQRKVLALIPQNLPTPAIARLQQELLKPFSDKDEPGYIYMFWLRDSPLSPFSTPSGTPLLTPPASPSPSPSSNTLSPPQPTRTRATSAALLNATLAPPTPGGTRPKLLLKIGRASNVQRRLHEWTQQCSHNLQLLRYYPHTSASTPGVVARKVPYANRVERLIHLELGARAGANPMVQCKGCGKTHKEWFEVDASREGVLGVDAVVKRWVAYGERAGGVATGAGKSKTSVATGVGKSKTSMASSASLPQKPQTAHTRPNPPKRANAANAAGTGKATATGGGGGLKMYEKKPKPVNVKVRAPTTPAGAKKKAGTAKAGRKKRVPRDENDVIDSDDDGWGEEEYSP
ncbi:meiotically up-regulated gene 113-domain-containing protein [Geopyxis carbonaria]|nr:meiotically up-regulated gene 113-domain-containing protein [Geopyxis carbonaria]